MRWSRRDENDSSLGELLDDDTTEHPRVDTGPTTPPEQAYAPVDPDTHPQVEGDGAATVPADEESFLDDEDYLPQERRGPGRITVALVAALVLAVGVFGGIWVQKQFGASSASAGTRSGTGTMPGGGASGMPGGGASGMPGGGGGGMPGGNASGGTGGMPGGNASGGTGGMPGGQASGGTNGSGTGTQTQATPAVVGTVSSVKSTSLVVTDLGGTKHTVSVSDSTTVTLPYAHSALKAGDTVSVVGTKADDGSVTATGITVT